jgi:hypothetical protein
VRTQAEHFRPLIPLISDHYTVYALDLPQKGCSEIVPGASYVLLGGGDEGVAREA